MVQNFIISWFRREAGLLFFTIKFNIILVCLLLFTGFLGSCTVVMAAEHDDTDSNVVVVIDPGHGGENLGGLYEDYTEKDMTLIVAKAMKEELDKYEGITVYLTRSNDKGMSLEERCDYAESVGADFLFCLHFNLSENHTLFGAETWISAFGEEYSKGYSFANVEMELLEAHGLYSRGIKTRLNDTGTDYYGIIRHCTEKGIPSVLIEHCHLDNENDKPFYDHNEKLQEFGRIDAEAAARYFGLKSDILGKDYSGYENIEAAVPMQAVRPDTTEPDVCIIELVEQNKKNGNVTLSLSAADYDSRMLYYSYSYDGGITFSELYRWPDKSRDTFEFTFNVPSGTIPQILVNAYNGYDLYTTSNALNLSSVSYESDYAINGEPAEDENDMQAGDSADTGEDGQSELGAATADALETSSNQMLNGDAGNDILTNLVNNGKSHEPVTFVYYLKVSLICVVIILTMIWSILLVIKRQKRKKRRRQTGK